LSLQGFLLFALGLVLVILGAELIVRSAARLAAQLGIKPLLIGLTVVALGTSAPEMAIGITAGVEGRGALAVGNIAGANLANILFILGLSAAIRPLHVHLLTIRLDLPAMIGTAILLLLMSWDGHLAQLEGMLLVGCGILYMAATSPSAT
jgi:cation:H+ antiporter